MSVRNPDGRVRNSRKPPKISDALERARSLETESLNLKRKGPGLEEIARQIKRVAQGKERPLVLLPDGVKFPADYTIAAQAVDKAIKRALNRIPDHAAREQRALDLQRVDEIILSQQKKSGQVIRL
jgi:hypothetical protein